MMGKALGSEFGPWMWVGLMLAAGGCGARSNLPDGPSEPVPGSSGGGGRGGMSSTAAAVQTATSGMTPIEPCSSDGTSTRGPRLICVPGGSFTLGDPKVTSDLRHDVQVAGFWMDETEVAVADYRRCVEEQGCSLPSTDLDCTWTDDEAAAEQHPINCVDFNQALQFCAWAGKTLPSEEQWEFAARGPGAPPREFPWGNEPPADQLCWNRVDGTCPVGAFPAGDTPEGLKDMAGGVREFAWACFGSTEGSCPLKAVGGSWITNDHGYMRSGFEFNQVDDVQRTRVTGFRCIR